MIHYMGSAVVLLGAVLSMINMLENCNLDIFHALLYILGEGVKKSAKKKAAQAAGNAGGEGRAAQIR